MAGIIFRFFCFVSLAAALIVAVSCGDKPPPSTDDGGRFFPLDVKQSYVKVRNARFSTPHDGTFIEVYANPTSSTAYANGQYPFVQGSVIVKVLHSDPEATRVVGYVAMRKGAPGTASSSGDWEWQDVDATGVVKQNVLVQNCIGCHTGCTEGRDMTCTDP